MASTIRQQVRRSAQSSMRQDRELGIGLLFNMARAGEIIPGWWSKDRDRTLRNFVSSSDHFQSAMWMISAKLANVPFTIQPRDRSIKAHQRLADQYQVIAQNGLQIWQGWVELWTRFYFDLWTTDNGAFAEVLGGGRPGGPLKGPAIGLAHLDSLQCNRTSNPEWPVIYQDVDGRRYRFHHTRIIYKSQMPSTAAQMYGVGHCWLSRAINNVQQLVDQDVYYQEALGSRPMRQFLLGRGISTKELTDSIRLAEEGMDNQGLRRYAKTAVVGDPDRVDIGIDSIPFSFLPEGYNKQEQTSIAMFVIALAGGFPPRWLWPATAAGATKADAMFQHISGVGGGAQWHLNAMQDLLSYSNVSGNVPGMLPPKFLPKELTLRFDFQDDVQDQQQAEIQDKRANTRKTDIEIGVITVRVAREQALADNDITSAQFAQMELEDGRLSDGDDVLTLFDSTDQLIIEMLDLGVEEPLLIDANDAIDMIIAIESQALEAQRRMVQARSKAEKGKARQALEALGKLKGVYEEIVGKEIEEQVAAEQAAGEFELPAALEAAPQEGAVEEAPEEAEVKARLLRRLQDRRYEYAADAAVAIILDDIATKETYSPDMLVNQFMYDLLYNVKAFKFGARVGERIRGGLFRGRGGKFASEGDISAIKSEILGRLIARLRAARANGTGKGGAKKKPKKGGGGGGKKKPDPAKLAQEKLDAERKKRAEIFGAMDGIDATAMESLGDFLAGGELDPDTAQTLAQGGFVRFDDTGNPVTTAAGRSIISAATKGDKRRVADVASKARESVAKVQARADKKREQAGKARERADDLTSRAEVANADADELDDDADELLAQADAEESERKAKRLRDRAAKLQKRAEKKRVQATDLQERAVEQDERAGELDTEAGQIEATIGAGLEPGEAAVPGTELAPSEPPPSETLAPDDSALFDRAVTVGDVTGDDMDRLVELGLFVFAAGGEAVLTLAGRAARDKTKAATEPPRGNFEQEINRQLKPVFRKAQVKTLAALQRGAAPDDEELRKELIALFVPILTDAALFKFGLFEDQFTIAFDAGETQVEAETWARQHAATLVAGLIATTQKIVRGVEPDSTQDEVETTVDRAFNENRREQIGVTETTVALMFGALLYQRLVRQRGVEIELRWFTREDELVCPICRPLNRTLQEIWSREFPGGPPAHVRCRCDVVAVRKR